MRKLYDLEAVRSEVLRMVERRKGVETDLLQHRGEIEQLLGSVSDYQPVWKALPSVFRLALIETSGGVVPYRENVVLPDLEHELPIVVEMMNFLRAQKGFDNVKMPLLLQPDEIDYALEHPAPCHCDELRTLEAGARRNRWLGRSASWRWREVQQDVLDRDKRRCTACRAPKDLHIHEVDPHAGYDPAGYVTLCRSCHVIPGGGLDAAATQLAFHLQEGEHVDGRAIRSQLSLLFQRGSLGWVAIALGREYVVLRS